MNRTIFPNGLTVLYHRTPQDPIAAGHFFFPIGSAHEPDAKWGMSSLMWSLFSKGTRKKTARQFAEAIESIGAFVGAGSTLDYAEASFNATSDQFAPAVRLLREALLEPVFLESEIEKERTALLASLKSKQENPFSVTHERLSALIFPNDPYGRPSGGRDSSVAALTKTDLENWRAHVVSPQGTILSLASDQPFEEILPVIEECFGSPAWPKGDQRTSVDLPVIPALEKKQESSVSAPFEQACLIFGFQAPAAGGSDYTAIKALNNILSGGMSTRLFQSLREKEGLAYDVSSFYPTRKRKSLFAVQMGLQPDKLEQAKKGIWRELHTLEESLVPQDELERTVRQIRGSFVLDHQTNSQRAHFKGWWEILGLGWNFDQVYLKNIDAVTPKDIQETARRLFSQPSIMVETVPNKARVPKKVPA